MKKALVAVSFGTGYIQTRQKTIEAIEEDLKKEFPERVFYRAWTSAFLRRKVLENEHLQIGSLDEILQEIHKAGIGDVLIQPTQMADGREFKEIRKQAALYAGSFETLSVGRPLLSREADIRDMAHVLESLFDWVKKEDMLVFMGHGSAEMDANPYRQLDACFREDGFAHFTVGTVEFEPGFSPVMNRARERNPVRIYLSPLMVVAGDHALHDMNGEKEESWASRFSRAGYETESILKGMGEYRPVRAMYVQHAKEAVRLQEEYEQ